MGALTALEPCHGFTLRVKSSCKASVYRPAISRLTDMKNILNVVTNPHPGCKNHREPWNLQLVFRVSVTELTVRQEVKLAPPTKLTQAAFLMLL